MSKISALILGAGLGTRMNSEKPKVLHLFDKKPLIVNIIKTLEKLKIKEIVVVVGYKGDEVEKVVIENFPQLNIKFVRQKLLKGSGRAVVESIDAIKNLSDLLILAGDVPLISKQTLNSLIETYLNKKVDAVVLSCEVKDPKSYGRIVRDEKGRIKAIVEAADLKDNEKNINEINSGIYIFKTSKLINAISNLKPKGLKKEYYLTDAIENIYKSGGKIESLKIKDELEVSGPNSKKELCELEKEYYKRNAEKLIEKGVIIKDTSRVYISKDVEIGIDSVIYPDVYIYGETKIGKNVSIGPNVIIEDCIIEDNCEIKSFTYISKSIIKHSSVVGPFSHIRPESEIGPEAKIGNFCEVKKSKIGRGSKVPHLSYVGDTIMGEKVNIGAGTITCNYDGVKKNVTIIGDRAFVGSNTNLVAPVKIGNDTLIGAGSTITADVPDGKLAIARERQIIKDRKK